MAIKHFSFETLDFWTDIRQLIKKVYEITSSFPENEKFGLVNQMRRSSISIGSNLAEGSSRTISKDQAHFYQIAFSSMMELLSQIIVCNDLNIINEQIYIELRKDIETIGYKLNALRNSAIKRSKS
jgi:four helix bundle protein